jgi:hypothetical protein
MVGKFLQAGVPAGSEKANSATGRWTAAITAASSAGRSAAKISWKRAGLIATPQRAHRTRVPALIDQATFERAQEQLARNAALSFRHKH